MGLGRLLEDLISIMTQVIAQIQRVFCSASKALLRDLITPCGGGGW